MSSVLQAFYALPIAISMMDAQVTKEGKMQAHVMKNWLDFTPVSWQLTVSFEFRQ